MPVVLWLRMMQYALRLSGRAMVRRWPWLLAAPAVSLLLTLLQGPVSMLGVAGGFVMGLVYAAAGSLLLYVGRGIIEQRRMDADDLTRGAGAFLGEVMNVLFVVWVVALVGRVVPMLPAVMTAALVVLPVFETVALTPGAPMVRPLMVGLLTVGGSGGHRALRAGADRRRRARDHPRGPWAGGRAGSCPLARAARCPS